MNIYLIINNKNIKSKTYPYFYIGSDSKDRTMYMGSSVSLKNDMTNSEIDQFKKIYLWVGDKLELIKLGYTKLTELENYYHIKYNVVKDLRYYNKARAIGGFETTGSLNAVYVNDCSKKIINLPKNHPDIISGKAVGMQTGNKFTISSESLKARENTCIQKYGTYPPSKSETVKNKLRLPKSEQTKKKMRKPRSAEHIANMKSPKSEKHKRNMSLNHKNNTKIAQYSTTDNLISEFNSIKDAANIALLHTELHGRIYHVQ